MPSVAAHQVGEVVKVAFDRGRRAVKTRPSGPSTGWSLFLTPNSTAISGPLVTHSSRRARRLRAHGELTDRPLVQPAAVGRLGHLPAQRFQLAPHLGVQAQYFADGPHRDGTCGLPHRGRNRWWSTGSADSFTLGARSGASRTARPATCTTGGPASVSSSASCSLMRCHTCTVTASSSRSARTSDSCLISCSARHIGEDDRPVPQPLLVGKPEVQPRGVHVFEEPLP